MYIKLNGKAHMLEAGVSIAALASQLGLSSKQVAIECNRQIVPRSRYAEQQLRDGDEVEVVHFIGGG